MKKKKGKDRERMRKEFKQRADESRRGRDARKTRGRGVFNLKEFDEVKFYSPDKGKHIIDFAPYLVSIDNHPSEDREGTIAKGRPSYGLIFGRHRNVGPEGVDVVCPKTTFGDPCPVCEELTVMRKSGDYEDDALNKLESKWRAAYNIIEPEEDSDLIQLFHVSAALFQDELWDEIKADGDDANVFFDPEEGSSISFRAAPDTISIDGKKVTFMRFKSFKLVEREEQLGDEIMDEAYPLDKMLIIHSYEELESILHRGEEEEEEEETPKRKKKGASKKTAKKKEESEEEEEEDSNGDCPHGYEFGKDCDEYEECQDCDKWKECANKQDLTEEESEEEEEEEEKPKRKRGKKKAKPEEEEEEESEEEEEEEEEEEKPKRKRGKKSMRRRRE